MNNISTSQKQKIIKLRNKKVHIQRNRKFVSLIILLVSLFIIGTSIKNMYTYYRCSDLIYAIDHYFTHWEDKNLRLIGVEYFNILSKVDNTIEIEAYGFGYEKPFNKKYLVGTFTKNSKGIWSITSMKLNNKDLDINNENTTTLPDDSLE